VASAVSEAPLPDQLEAARGLLSGTGEGRKRGREDSPELGHGQERVEVPSMREVIFGRDS